MWSEKRFKKIAWLVLSLVLGLSVFFAINLSNITVDYNFEDFYPANDEETAFFQKYRAEFESDNDFLLLSITNDESVLNNDFIKDAIRFRVRLSELTYVVHVQDITQSKDFRIYHGGVTTETPVFDTLNFNFKNIQSYLVENPELFRSYISEDFKSINFFIKHEDFLSKAKSDELVKGVKALVNDFDFKDVKLAGRTVGQLFYIDLMTNEMLTYVGFSLVLIVLFLALAFRSVWGVFVPQIVIVLSMVWVAGFMGAIDMPFNILLVILPSIMFVVGMSDVIHFVSKYLELLREGKNKFDAIKIAFKEIGLATFLTSLTTAIGFFSLLFVNVKPIQTFGLVVGAGVLVAFLITFSTLPFLFYFTKTPKLVDKKKSSFWVPYLRKMFLFTMRNQKVVIFSTIVFCIIFIFGGTKLIANNFILDDVNPKLKMKQDFVFFDQEFGGIRPFELSISLEEEEDVWDLKNLKKIEKLEDYLRNEYGVKIQMSLVSAIALLNQASNGGNHDYFKVPSKKSKLKNYKRMLKTAEQGAILKRFLSLDEKTTRISGNVPDWGNIKSREKNQALLEFIDNELNVENLSFTITGSAHLLDKNMYYMSTSLVYGLAFALLMVSLIMAILFRSLKMIVIALIPNLIPLIFIVGLMGFFDIHLKITTAVIFTIAFGIAVDDTIHFLSKMKIELSKGRSFLYALKRTYFTTGKAIVLTSAVLCSGFLLLMFSNFMGTYYLGLMISFTLFLAVFADLFLLPVLLFAIKRKEK